MFKNLKNLNRKQNRAFRKWSTAINLNQSNEFLFKSFINYYRDLTNNPNFMKKENYAVSCIYNDWNMSLKKLKNNHF